MEKSTLNKKHLERSNPQPDLQKRKTLKIAATSVAGAAGFASAGAAMAACNHAYKNTAPESVAAQVTDYSLGEISAQVKHNWASNDISVVLTNKGSETSVITAITPMQINLARGSIDFSELLAEGSVVLQPGESVVAPFKPATSATPMLALENFGQSSRGRKANGYGHFDRSLQGMLRSQLSIVTEGDSFAAVTVVNSPIIG